MNGYELSRVWFNFCFDNPEKIKPNHTALYFFCVEHCNRLGWKSKFGLPTTMAKEAIGIRSYNTYINTLNDLVEWGFIEMIERSKNQYSSNIIALSKFDKALDEALDRAFIKHGTKQGESTGQSIDSIDKPLTTNLEQEEQENNPKPKFWKPQYLELYERVVELFPVNTQPKTDAQKNKWLDDIRKLVEIDGFDLETIYHVSLKVRNDSFWSKNFQSLLKLRAKDKHGVKYIDVFINTFKEEKKAKGVDWDKMNRVAESVLNDLNNGNS
jgi:hypothetical protein